MRGGSWIGLVVAMILVAVMPAAAQADSTPWSIGAAKVDTTPPLFDAAQDLQDFPELDLVRQVNCPRTIFDGPRLWRFEEPYQDTDGSGDFNYPDNGGVRTAEPFCDYNHNGRWEGIYLSGGADHHAVPSQNPINGYSGPGHDPIDARAVAFSDGSKTVVLVSVVAQGIFENYIREARTMAQGLAGQPPHQQRCGHIDEMVVSSNHNESSPDTIGLYGAPEDPSGTIGLNSGIDEYYMDWLDEQMAIAAVEACDNRRQASLWETEFPVPPTLEQEIPNRFPTTEDSGEPAAIDPKVRVLQARGVNGNPIFTMMNLADHNQDIGQSDTFEESHTTSSDWPGYFHRHLEQEIGGMAMFVAADMGSMEDLITDPRIPGPPCFSGANGCYAQVEATGNTIADHVAGELPGAKPVPLGAVDGRRTEFCAPIENNLFKAAATAGIFGERQAYTNCQPTGRAGDEVKTSVAVLDVGPDLQFIVNPGEAFPSLMLGGPWGIEDASCPNSANPPVPTWRAGARYRFQVGLGDDLIGYEKQAWSFEYGTPTFAPMDGCTGDTRHTHHGLEDEALGPTASNMVAQKLADLLDARPDPTAEVRLGRYVKADGTLTDAYTGPSYQGAPGHFPADAVAIWLAAPGSTTLDPQPGNPDSGTIVALGSIGSFGDRQVDANGAFMDFDGAEEPNGPDVVTRGMLVKASDGNVQRRYYVNVYPALTVSGSLGPAGPPYPTPVGASPLRVSLVPAFNPCDSSASNAGHAAPLSGRSCSAPVPSSSLVAVGPKSLGLARLIVLGSGQCAPFDSTRCYPDATIRFNITDVRSGGTTGPDYDPSGSHDLTGAAALADTSGPSTSARAVQITDRNNKLDSGTTYDQPATVTPLAFPIPIGCTATPSDPGIGSACNVQTTANTLFPGAAVAGKRAIWELGQLQVLDQGANGTPGDADDKLFEVQGVFVP